MILQISLDRLISTFYIGTGFASWFRGKVKEVPCNYGSTVKCTIWEHPTPNFVQHKCWKHMPGFDKQILSLQTVLHQVEVSIILDKSKSHGFKFWRGWVAPKAYPMFTILSRDSKTNSNLKTRSKSSNSNWKKKEKRKKSESKRFEPKENAKHDLEKHVGEVTSFIKPQKKKTDPNPKGLNPKWSKQETPRTASVPPLTLLSTLLINIRWSSNY